MAQLLFLSLLVCCGYVNSFVPLGRNICQQDAIVCIRAERGDWIGEVVSSNAGRIKGCKIQQLEGSLTEWIVQIDGVEADLGKFSEAVYKKVIMDAKKQRFQGFRPGTIPPQLLTTYKAFAMDEVCRETTLEAMHQNNINPFDGSREAMQFVSFSIPPPLLPKFKKSRKTEKGIDFGRNEADAQIEATSWRYYENMKDAINGGWQPGQSFSFQATNVKGQKIAPGGLSSSNPLAGF